jgi:cytochrome P450
MAEPSHAELPAGPENPPAVQLLNWLFRPIEFLDSCRDRYGDTFSVTFPGFETPMVMISRPEHVAALFKERDNGLPPGRTLALEPILGPRSVLLLEGSEHLARRRVMLPAFHGERMLAYEQQIESVIEREIDSWSFAEAFSIHRRMQAVTLEVILHAVFGVSDERRRAQLRPLLRTLLDRTAGPRLQVRFMASRRVSWIKDPLVELRRSMEDADRLLALEAAERRADPELESRTDILSMLVAARFEDGEPMSDSELRDQLMTLLVAGHETTATALAWTFDLLLRNPGPLERLRDEVRAGDGDQYLRATITEALRLRPVVPLAGRRLAHSLDLDGSELPAGTDVAPAIWLTHTRPEIYPDPLAFRPERFLEEGPETYSWIPFGGGVRRCLGAAFAEFEMRVVLRAVLDRCELEGERSRPERITRRNVTFSPKHGTPVRLRSRRSARPEHAQAPA